MKRKLLVIVLIIVMLVGILHEGKINNDQTEEDRINSIQHTENVYLWYSDESCTDFFTNAAVAFHEKNPGIRVIPTYVDSNEYLENINRASVAGESFPDIIVLSNNSLEKAYLAGLASQVRDNDAVLNSNHFSKTALDSVTYQNKLIGYPFTFEASILLYNKAYLEDWVSKLNEGYVSNGEYVTAEELGDDYDDSPGEEIVEKEEVKKVYTLEDMIPETFDDIKAFADGYEPPEGVGSIMKWDVKDVFFNYMFIGSSMIIGGDAGDDVNNLNIYNDEAVAGIEYYQKLGEFFSIEKDESDYDSVIKDFLDGKTVFTVVTSDAIPRIEANIQAARDVADEKRLEKERLINDINSAKTAEIEYEDLQKQLDELVIPKVPSYGYSVIPDLTPELKSRSLSVTEALVINGYSEVKDAANKFAAFVTTEYAGQIYPRVGKLAASVNAGYTEEIFTVFQQEYSKSISLPKMVELSNLWVELEICLSEIWGGKEADKRFKTFEAQLKSQLLGE